MTRPDQTRPDQTRPDQTVTHVRNSSLELLRIFAILIIVGSHFSQHGFSLFSIDSITFNRLWLQFLFLGGNQGNIIFVMLSGYFLIKSHGIKSSKIIDLISRVFFYATVVYLLLEYVDINKVVVASTKSEYISILNLAFRGWWFIRPYFVMYLLHPYVNVFLHSITRENYKKFLVSIFIFWGILSAFTELKLTFSNQSKSLLNLNNIISFLCLYSLAGYFRLWANDFGSKRYIIYGFMWIMMNMLTVIVLDVIGLHFPIVGKNAMFFNKLMMPCAVMAALCLLLGFRKLQIPYNKVINVLASTSLGVYMLHENRFSSHFLWHDILNTELFKYSPYLILYSFAMIFIVYISCAIIELLRSKIFSTLSGEKLS